MKMKALPLALLAVCWSANCSAEPRRQLPSARPAPLTAAEGVPASSWLSASMEPPVTDGDPINLYSGLYVRTTVDLSIEDTIPLEVQRTYRNNDHFSRTFGVGTNHPYDMFVTGDGVKFSYVNIITADGAPIRFDRISPGTGYADAILEHTATPTAFLGARMAWNGSGWTVKFKDGSFYKFLGCSPKSTRPGQCGLIEYRNRYGQTLRVNRDADGNITRMVSPHREWIAFTYDDDRVVRAEGSTGISVTYEYDRNGRLVKVQSSEDPLPIRYEYDDDDHMTAIFDHGQVIHNAYRQDYCVYQLSQYESRYSEFRFNYVFDSEGRHVATEVRTSDNAVRRVTFNASGYLTSDTRRMGQPDQATLSYDRNPQSNKLEHVTLSCASQGTSKEVTHLLDSLETGDGGNPYDEIAKLCKPSAAPNGSAAANSDAATNSEW
jgi:YD repeat-containing protein